MADVGLLLIGVGAVIVALTFAGDTVATYRRTRPWRDWSAAVAERRDDAPFDGEFWP